MPDHRHAPFLTMHHPFYEDFAVYAFPSAPPVIADINEKALYKLEPCSSFKHVKTYLPLSNRNGGHMFNYT